MIKTLSLTLFVAALTAAGFGQTQVVIPAAPAADLSVEVADQPECPIRLIVETKHGGKAPSAGIYARSVSDKPVLGFSVIAEGETESQLFGNALPPGPLTRQGPRTVVNFISEPGRFLLRVDVVVFTDGSTWGSDEQHQAKPINDLYEDWKLVDQRLREIAAAYPNPEDFTRVTGTVRPGWATTIGKGRGMPTQMAIDMKNFAYDAILSTLRRHGPRDPESQEIARKLELLRTPGGEK